ncbi:sugar phosphate isomerase/epimerase family protein [Roseimaritima sediminicola]|uniref:sugar phosphate isomerase/epimerase family protein n=1 Tax=Roseimaritima sediminicola TaxID=2662066 RepID=UPI00129840BB|nr:sugar phosphate isomerase/epimerase family protein [Roseimaritima sediminicola]
MNLNRRQFVAACTASALLARTASATPSDFQFNYLVGSSMYGYTDLKDIVPEVPKTGAKALDIWPKVHGNQREQLDAMGEAAFQKLLDRHGVQLGCITQYKLGPFRLQDEMRLAGRLGCQTIVCGGKGPKRLKGTELKTAVGEFAEQMKPHLAVAEETGVTIAIENHGNNLIESPDSLKWLVELCPSKHLGVALAPYHLEQDPQLIAGLIESLGNRIAVFYAWQHGMGSVKKLPKEQELMQMPGRGELDFGPLVDAMKAVGYAGWTEIFMHPVPRGVPILEPTAAVTAEINRSRDYLESLL